MRTMYPNISQLIQYKDKCIFCQSKLKTILTNHINFKNVPTLNSKYKKDEDEFEFELKYNAASIDLRATIRLDATEDFLIFDKPIESEHYDKGLCKYSDVYDQALRIFNDMYIHTESYCASRKCGLKYYFNSNPFHVWNTVELPDHKCLIPVTQLHDECFSVEGFWIQNDLLNDKTNIYSIKHPNKEPIAHDLIDFTSTDKDRLLNKIKMLVTFS